MEKQIIKQVIAVSSQGTSVIRVGKDGVTTIQEFIDSSDQYFNIEYVAMIGEKVYKRFINLPVEVECFV